MTVEDLPRDSNHDEDHTNILTYLLSCWIEIHSIYVTYSP